MRLRVPRNDNTPKDIRDLRRIVGVPDVLRQVRRHVVIPYRCRDGRADAAANTRPERQDRRRERHVLMRDGGQDGDLGPDNGEGAPKAGNNLRHDEDDSRGILDGVELDALAAEERLRR